MYIGNTADPLLPATEKKGSAVTNEYQSSGTKKFEALKTVGTNVMIMSDV